MRTVEEQIAAAQQAGEELRATTREAYEARAALRDIVKLSKALIVESITGEVERQIAVLAGETRTIIRERIDELVDEIATELRSRLKG